MFLRPIARTDERVAIWGQTLLRPVNLGKEYCHTKWGLPYNLIIDLGQTGCSTSYTGWDTLVSYLETQTYKYCFLNGRSGYGVPDTSVTIVEESDDQINDEVAIDAALQQLSDDSQ